MMEEQINDKARELAKKFFPDEENIWARENIEATKAKLACLEMAKYLQEERWISVTDELPPKESEYDDNSIVVLATDGNGVYKGLYRSDEYLSGWFTCDLLGLDNITHWMPLPQPPKKGGEK